MISGEKLPVKANSANFFEKLGEIMKFPGESWRNFSLFPQEKMQLIMENN